MRGEEIEPQEQEAGVRKGKKKSGERGTEEDALTEGESSLLAELQ